MRGSVGVYLPAMVEGKVFIIKLSGDKRVLLCVYVCVVYGTYWQVVCVCVCVRRACGEKRSTRGGELVLLLRPPHYHHCTCH